MMRELARDRGYRDAFCAALLDDGRIGRDHHHLALTIAFTARPDGTRAIAPHDHLTRATRLSLSTVKRRLTDLREWGWLLVERRGHRAGDGRPIATMYTLCIPVLGTVDNQGQQLTQVSPRDASGTVEGPGPSTDHGPDNGSQQLTQVSPRDQSQQLTQVSLWPRSVDNPSQQLTQVSRRDSSQQLTPNSQQLTQVTPAFKELSPLTPPVVNPGRYVTCDDETADAPDTAVGAAS